MASDNPAKQQADADIDNVWQNSDERKKVRKTLTWGLAGSVFWVAFLGVSLFILYQRGTLSERGPLIIIGGSAVLSSVGLYTATFTNNLRQTVRERYWRQKAEELGERERDIGESEVPPSFFKLWSTTQDRIKLYHDIATDQSRVSFRDARRAIVFGFFVILVTGVLAYSATDSSASIAAGAIGVAAAGLSAYIGSTFMKAQAEASSQLREYFLQPVEFSRVLAAERLIELIDDPGERGSAVTAIIKGMMPNKE